MPLIMTVDVGNTRISLGLFRGETLTTHWCLSTERHCTADELAWQMHGLFSQSQLVATEVSATMIASVVPHLDGVLAEACRRVCGVEPAFVGSPEVKTGMAVDYKHPREVGADRIANAVAARERYGAPVIVMDCGTATTFDMVSPAGHYAGGLIVPGSEIALQALSERAAKLPEVPFARMQTLIGRDTVSSMQAGSYWAAVEGFAGILRRLHALADYAEAPVVITGGLAPVILDDMADIREWRPHLTLEGLRLLAERNLL